MDNPKVSIVIPVYNAEAFLEKCLNSITAQSYRNLEIICVNDGSSDSSLQILESYAKADERFVVIDKKNEGVSEARNTGTRKATGQYLMYVDSDDWIEPETCEVAVAVAQEHQADLVFWDYLRDNGSVSKEAHVFQEPEIVFSSEAELAGLHRRFVGLYEEELAHPERADSLAPSWGKLYRAELVKNERVAFIDTKIIGNEDGLFNLHALAGMKKAVYIHRCFYHYRKVTEGSFTTHYRRNLWDQWNALFAHYKAFLDEHQKDASYYAALNNRIALSIIGLGMNIFLADKSVNKYRQLTLILRSDVYRQAVRQLKLQWFPIHWKVFFLFAKLNFTAGVYLLLVAIRRFQRKLRR